MSEATDTQKQPIDVGHVLAFMIDQLADLSWQKLGLRHDPITNALEKDLDQARLAIDATDALVKVLRPHLEGEDQRQLDNLARDLKMNYMNHGGTS